MIKDTLAPIWRLPLRSGKPGVPHDEQVEYCVSRGVAALGWGVTKGGELPDVLRRIEGTYDRRSRVTVERFATAPMGSLVWTLNTYGMYWVGELTGEWEYDGSTEAVRLDCHQVRTVEWAPPPALLSSEAPGAVVRSFSQRGHSFSRIHDDIARDYSHRLFGRLVGRAESGSQPTLQQVLRSHLDPFDAEDLVYVFLQARRGFLVLPGSRRTDTAGYEYVLMHPQSREQAIVQVKTGDSSVDIAELARAEHKAFAFSTTDRYDGDDPRVEKLTSEELLRFMADEPGLLPPRVRGWLAR